MKSTIYNNDDHYTNSKKKKKQDNRDNLIQGFSLLIAAFTEASSTKSNDTDVFPQQQEACNLFYFEEAPWSKPHWSTSAAWLLTRMDMDL